MTYLHLANSNSETAITSTRVDGANRINILSKYFPDTFLVVENAVFHFAKKFCSQYPVNNWHLYELSNGGFYMAPDASLAEVNVCFSNGYADKISPDALGIIIGINVYSAMAEDHPEANFQYFYWRLRNFADKHPEMPKIYRAID